MRSRVPLPPLKSVCFHTLSRSLKNLPRHGVLAVLIVSVAPVLATTVIPPTFDELVGRAEVIFQGSVTEVQSKWVGEGAQRHIVSYITFNVEDTIKGAPERNTR